MRENLELKIRLDNPIPENIKELQSYEKKQWKKRLHRFVETESSRIILESMKKDQCILVSGPQGCGKSSLAFHIALTLEDTEGFELLIVTNPDDIVRYASQDKKQIFIIDDIFGKYSVHEYDSMWWSKQGHLVLTLMDINKDFKILATCRSYVYRSVDIVTVKSSFVHHNLIADDFQLTEDNRRTIGKSYLSAGTIDQLDSKVIMKLSFFPTLCADYSFDMKETVEEYFSTPYSYVAAEIEKCNKTKDLHYFSLALMVILNNNVKKEKLHNDIRNQDKHFNELIHGLANEIGYSQIPSKQSVCFCLKALVGSYSIETEDGFSFMNETFLNIIAHVMSQHILRSLLKYGKTPFLKDRVQFLSLNGHPPKLTIMIPGILEKAFFDRMLIDIKQGLFWDVITGMQNAFPQFRKAFISYMKTMLKRNELKSSNSDDGSTVLHAVALEGYDDYLTYFLDFDKSLVNKDNKFGQIPLHLACLKGHSHTAQLLLEKGAFIDKTDTNENTSLDLACAGGHSDTVAVLLSKKATINQGKKDLKTALHVVCSNGNSSIAKMLLDRDAKVDIRDKAGHTPLHSASLKGHVELVALLIQHNASVNIADNKGRTALFLSCEKKQKAIAKILLEYKASTLIDNEDGKRPIHRCCEVGSSEITELLLFYSVDINQRDSKLESTPLHWACRMNHEHIVKMLLERNADVNLQNKSRETPLHIACKNGHLNIIHVIKMLLEHDAVVDCRNIFTMTPLHLACEQGLHLVIPFLLEHGANVDAKEQDSRTSFHLACYSGNRNIVDELS